MKILPPSLNEKAVPASDEAADKTKDKNWQSAKKFESYFVGFVFEKAFETIPKSELFEGSHDDMFQSMLIQNMTDQMSKSPRGMGVADQIYRELKAREGSSHSPDAPLKEALGRAPGIDLAQVVSMKPKTE